MIPPLELRIDNYVSYKGEYMRVFSINHRDAQMCAYSVLLDGVRSKMGIPVTEIDPIPLTPELLLKCGFKDRGKQDDSDELGQYVKDGIGMWPHSSGDYTLAGSFDVDIKHLHHLQNLYFAINKTELDISL